MSRITQRGLILNHLKDFGSIEPMLALREYGVYRLAAVIELLRKDGHNIQTEMIPHTNKNYGIKTRYAKYSLVKKASSSNDYLRATQGY